MRKIASHPSLPGLAVGIVALFVALAGSAIGLPGKKVIDKNDLKNNVVQSKNIAANGVAGDDIGADQVTGADVAETTLGKVPSAASADNAASSDGPLAYAHVDYQDSPDAGVHEEGSKGITDSMVSSPGTGKFCIVQPFAVKGAQVTVDESPSSFAREFARVDVENEQLQCPAGNIFVHLMRSDTNASSNADFYIVLYK